MLQLGAMFEIGGLDVIDSSESSQEKRTLEEFWQFPALRHKARWKIDPAGKEET